MVTLFSILAALLPIMVYVGFLRWMDRYEREPIWAIWICFALGASFVFAGCYYTNTFIDQISSRYFTAQGADYFFYSLVAPVVEESIKGIFLVIFFLLSKELDNVTDGLIYGAVIGLGFALSENIMYFNRIYDSSGMFIWIKTIYMRGFFLAGVHATATAFTGGVCGLIKERGIFEKITTFPLGLALAIMVHSFWNAMVTVGSLFNDDALYYIPYFLLPVLVFFLFILLQVSLFNESKIMQRTLTLEAYLGVLPAKHIAYIKSYFGRNSNNWLPSYVNKKSYLTYTTELAFMRATYDAADEQKRKCMEVELNELRGKIKTILQNPSDLTAS